MDYSVANLERSENMHAALIGYGFHSSEARDLFLSKCTIKSYNKNEIIFSEGKNNENEYCLLEGLVHRFNTNEQGDQVTTGFYIEQSVITPHFARTLKGKSLFSLQALAETQMAEFPVAIFNELRYAHKDFQAFGQKVIEAEISKNILTDIAYRTSTAKERLLALRASFPTLENAAPHQIIASYLGITKVSFSRLRGEFSRK